MADSVGGHELALTIINTGAGYEHRRSLGRAMLLRDSGKGASAQCNAGAWLNLTLSGARAYERQFGNYGASCFTPQDILAAAIELADYYEARAREDAAYEASQAAAQG